jgi:hypothetical protein
MTLDTHEFIRRVLVHVLPKGIDPRIDPEQRGGSGAAVRSAAKLSPSRRLPTLPRRVWATAATCHRHG